MTAKALVPALLVALLAAGARADVGDAEPEKPAPPLGLVLGARAGLGLAVGSARKDVAMADAIRWGLPLEVELGYRLTDRFSAGLYFQGGYAFGSMKLCEALRAQLIASTSTTYTPSAACSTGSGYALRVGLQGIYRMPLPGRAYTPWAGVSVGLEYVSATVEVKQNGQITNGTYKWDGPEWLGLQGGLEWPMGSGLTLGPFAAATFSRYSSESLSVSGNGSGWVSGANGASVPSGERAFHAWLMVGARGTFDF